MFITNRILIACLYYFSCPDFQALFRTHLINFIVLDSVNWERLFDGKNINAQVISLNETILNGFRNYVPNKYIAIDDKDPVWMNEIIKSKIKTKNLLFKQYIQNGRFESDFVFLQALITEINELISSTRNVYYENLAKKLNNPLLQVKTYWSILKTFYNEKISH